MITSIRLENFKRQNTEVKLSGRDIFVGPNGIGKSARLQGLSGALLGYIPGATGKRPQDTFFYSTGDTMSFGVETENFGFDRSYTRRVRNNPDGTQTVSISQRIDVSPSKGEGTLKEKEARIDEELGNFPVMLDFGEFLAMSDADRRAFFYTLAGVDGNEWTKGRVEEQLRSRILTETLQENNPDAYAIYETLITDALKEWRSGLDAEAGVQAMLEWARSQQRHWNSKKRDAAGAVRQLAGLKNELAETDRNIEGHQAEIEELQKELTGIVSQIDRAEDARKAVERRAKRISELKERIAELSDVSTIVIELNDKEVESTYIDVEAMIKELKGQVEAVPTDDTDYDGLIKDLESEIDKVTAASEELGKKIVSLQGRAEGLKKSVEQASDRGGVCVIAANISCDKDFTPWVEWAQEQIESATSEAELLQAERDALRKKRETVRDEIRAINDLRNKAAADAKSIASNNQTLESRIRTLKQSLADHDNAEKLRLERLSDVEQELARLEKEGADTATAAPVEVLTKQRDGVQSKIDDLKAKVEEQQKARTTISNMQVSMITSTEAEYSFNGSRLLVEALGPKGIQGEMLVGALGPIQDDITANLKAMGFDNEFFFRTESDRGQEVFRFGRIDDEGREVDFDALSTGQQLIVLVAMLVAIIDRADPKLRVLALDNIENLDKDNFSRLIGGLNAMIDKLHNVLIAGVINVDDIDGWTVHRLGVLEEVAV